MNTRVLGLVCCAAICICGCDKKAKSNPNLRHGYVKKPQPDRYRAQDAELIGLSNKVPVYSTPRQAEKILGTPTQVQSSGAEETVYYSLGGSSREVLRLRYHDGKLIGKEIIPSEKMPK